MDSGIQVAAMIVIASFVIDRVTGGTLFVLSLFDGWNRIVPDPATVDDPRLRLASQKRATIVYYLLVALLAIVLVTTFDIRVLEALGIDWAVPWSDRVFSVLVLMGGSDQVAALLKTPHSGKALPTAKIDRPIEVIGKIVLEDRADRMPPPR